MSACGLLEGLVPDHQVRSRAALRAGDLSTGNKVSYPGQGPCRIGHVVKRFVEGRVIMFYHLTMLDDRGGELFVPVEKAPAIGVRLLVKSSEIPQLLECLKKAARTVDNWKEHANENLKLFTAGSAFDLAGGVASLTQLRTKRSLTLRESRTLERARYLLICEISEVTGETVIAAGKQVDEALTAGRDES
jgi:CarD family transcriptional regulator